MSTVSGEILTKVFGCVKGGTAEKVFREMERITNAVNLGQRPGIDRFDPYTGKYEGREIVLLLLETEKALHEYCAAHGIHPQREALLIKDGYRDQSKRIRWGEQELLIRPTTDSKAITNIANLILSAFLRHGYGWYGIPGVGANAETVMCPYPWGGSLRKAPPDRQDKGGRGGFVVLNLLSSTGRVLTDKSRVHRLGGNRFVKSMFGVSGPTVMYGSTGITNVFEFLELLKVAHYLGVSAIFDSDDSAHNMDYYWQRTFIPSMKMLGVEVTPQELGLYDNAKYNTLVHSPLMYSAFERLGFDIRQHMAASAASHNHSTSFGQWYRDGATLFARKVLELFDLKVDFKVVPTETIWKNLPIWHTELYALGLTLRRAAGHEVGLINTPEGKLISAGQLVSPPMTVGQALAKGWWMSGAAIYHTMYSLGMGGDIIYMVKDSKAGRVHLLAREFLKDERSGLHLCPVGLFRMCADGQNEDDQIDVWALLELISRWGDDKARTFLQQIWDSIEVPLKREHIGNKTVARIGLNGVEIEVKQDR